MAPFEEESDEDSISVNATPEPEDQGDYNVETILHEAVFDGETKYLTKWEGWALGDSTYEPANHFNDDRVLQEWNAQKLKVQNDAEKAFDLSIYHKAQATLQAAYEDRIKRRRAKRRRLGLPVSSDESEEGEVESPEPVLASPKRRRSSKKTTNDSDDSDDSDAAGAKPSRKKGIAKPIANTTQARRGREQRLLLPDDGDSDGDSLFGERQTDQNASNATATAATKGSSAANPPLRMRAPAQKAFTASMRPPTASPQAARKTVHGAAKPTAGSSGPTAKRTIPKVTGSIFAHVLPPPGTRATRRVSGSTRKDSTDTTFKRLSIQHKYQKYGKNEPAPNPDALTITDPKTGRTVPPVMRPTVTTNVRKGPDEIHSAYGRRSSPPRRTRQRSPTPPPPAPPQQPALERVRTVTCHDWQSGTCRYTDKTCNRAHWVIEPRQPGVGPSPVGQDGFADSRRGTTCAFWLRGNCRNGANCAFAHFDTGVYANTAIVAAITKTRTGQDRFQSFSEDTPILDAGVPSSRKLASPRTDQIEVQQPSIASHLGPAGPIAVKLAIRASGLVPTVVEAHLAITDRGAWASSLRPPLEIHLDRMLTASDMQHVIAPMIPNAQEAATGTISAIATSATSLEVLDSVIDMCRLHAAGLVELNDKYTIIVYPSRMDEWKFIERAGLVASETPLRFQILPPLDVRPADSATRSVATIGNASVAVGVEILGLEVARLFPSEEGSVEGHKVMIIMPTGRQVEIDVLTRFFQGLKCKVYQSGTPGAWSYFRSRYTSRSTLVVHPDTHLWEIPGLQKHLLNDGKNRVWSIGVDHVLALTEDIPPTYSCERIFPFGGATFITDDMFVHQPHEVTALLDRFQRDTKDKPVGGEFHKFFTRPGIDDWLLELALQPKVDEEGLPDMRWKTCYGLLDTVREHVISPDIEDFPHYIDLWEKDRMRATETMVQWFAGWSAFEARKYRRIVVCHEPKDSPAAQEWVRKYQHLIVMTPAEMLELMRKRKK